MSFMFGKSCEGYQLAPSINPSTQAILSELGDSEPPWYVVEDVERCKAAMRKLRAKHVAANGPAPVDLAVVNSPELQRK